MVQRERLKFLLNCSKAGIRFPAIRFPPQVCQSNSSAFCSSNCWVFSCLWLTSLITKLTNQHEVNSGHLMDTCPLQIRTPNRIYYFQLVFFLHTELVFYQPSQGAASNTSLHCLSAEDTASQRNLTHTSQI